MEQAKKKITLNDIAEILGVSKATVSLAINNDSRVAAETRRKILSTVEELGYVYNRGAAGLSTGRSNTVGLAVHNFTNPYFAEACAECEALLSLNNIMAFLCNTNESLEHQEHFIRTLIEHRADGLILSPAEKTNIQSLQPVVSMNLPTVLIARNIEGVKLDFVGNDGVLAIHMATTHLINLGHKKIAMVGGNQHTSVSRNRRAGFAKAMEENGLPVSNSVYYDCSISPQGGEEAITAILSLKSPPTALVCFSDLIALGVLSGLHRRDLTPGKDMAVVGCDDIEEADRGYTQLTTVRIRKGEIGRKAAELLIRRINNPRAPVKHMHLKSELIIRESCGSGRS
ncbi:MAG: LacI family DNA-binding transcriptional regulator [Desulfocapsaceae bacterium]|jgi:LacI family transcriptional regulator|nr:LacI family DNA-binding transcriptional regulator [Desulfocapsaceae bacterium]